MSAKVIQLREVATEEPINIGEALRILGYDLESQQIEVKEEIERENYIKRVTENKRKAIRHESTDANIKGEQRFKELIKRKEEQEKHGKEPEEIAADAFLEMVGAYKVALHEIRTMYVNYLRYGYPPLPVMDDILKRDIRDYNAQKPSAKALNNFYYKDFEGKGNYGNAFNYDEFKRKFDEKKLRNYMWGILTCINSNR